MRAPYHSLLLQVAIEMEVSMLGKTGGDGTPLRERSEDLQVGWVTSASGLQPSRQLPSCLQPGSVCLACPVGVLTTRDWPCMHLMSPHVASQLLWLHKLYHA